MPYLYSLLMWIPPVLTLFALFASLRHTRMAKTMPLLSGGLALLLFRTLFSNLLPTISEHVLFPTINPLMPTIHLIISLVGIGAWALIIFGLHAVLEELSGKLTYLQPASQPGWNSQTISLPLQTQQAENPVAADDHTAFVVPPEHPDTPLTLGVTRQ